MNEYRLLFKKEGPGIYISHLDLMRTMQRVFLRAGFRVWHTEGFNPRPYMVFALPLPVGCASQCEMVDFRLEQESPYDSIPEALRVQCPSGIEPIAAWTPERKFKDIKYLKMNGILEFDRCTSESDSEAAEDLFSRDGGVIVRRKTKRGEGDFDISPHIRDFHASASGGNLLVSFILSAQEPTVNPILLQRAMERYIPEHAPAFASWTRMEMLDAEMNLFK